MQRAIYFSYCPVDSSAISTAWYILQMRKKNVLTTKEVAERCGVAYPTVILWIQTGKLEAVKEPTPRGDIWLIPESSLKTLDRGGKGRPKKATKRGAK